MKKHFTRLIALLLIAASVCFFPVFPGGDGSVLTAAAASGQEYESALFPMDELRIVRTNTKLDKDQNKIADKNGGHVWFAWDLSGNDTSVEAPFTGTILAIDKGNEHATFFQSKNKVYMPNGKLDYLTIMLVHDDNINDLKVGQEIRQGGHLYDQGTFGKGKKGTYDRHLHIEAAVGKIGISSKNSVYKNISLIRNHSVGVQLSDCFFLKANVKRTRDYIVVVCQNNKTVRFPWKTMTDMSKVSVSVTDKTYNAKDQQVKDFLLLKNGNTVLVPGKDYTIDKEKVRNVGKYDVTLIGIGQYSGKIRKTVTVKPRPTWISSTGTYKLLKRVSLKWNATPDVTGYKVQISRSNSFSSAHTTNVDAKTTGMSFSKVNWGTLKSGVTYYLRVCTVKKVSYAGKTVEICSIWSPVKSVRF